MCEGRNRVDEKLKIGEIDLLSKEACECYATPQVATSSSGVEQRAKQRLAPFHTICTPMQTSRKEVSFTMTFVPV